MRVFLCCALAALLAVSIATAQVGGSGTIQGTVTDPSGAVVAGASVVATNVETGVQTNRKTTDAGFFVLSPLPPGEYTLRFLARENLNGKMGTFETKFTVPDNSDGIYDIYIIYDGRVPRIRRPRSASPTPAPSPPADLIGADSCPAAPPSLRDLMQLGSESGSGGPRTSPRPSPAPPSSPDS